MLLCDVGNTSYHFLDGENDYKKSTKEFDPSSIKQTVYYICVNPHAKSVLVKLDNWIDLSRHVEMQNYYETMGIDRIMACEAIDKGVIVDAGSAITVDVVKDAKFEGGFIYPGSKAMAQTYKRISSALEYEFNYNLDLHKLPKNSVDAISYGYLKILYSEVNSYNLPIVLTGGDAELFKKIFPHAKIDTQLLFHGMKKIIKKNL